MCYRLSMILTLSSLDLAEGFSDPRTHRAKGCPDRGTHPKARIHPAAVDHPPASDGADAPASVRPQVRAAQPQPDDVRFHHPGVPGTKHPADAVGSRCPGSTRTRQAAPGLPLQVRSDLLSHDESRQPGDQRREEGDQHQDHKKRDEEWQRGPDDPLEGQAGDPGHDKEDDAEGRRQEADHQIEHHDQAEMERVDAHLDDDRHEHGSEDQDGHHGFHEAADDQQEDVEEDEQDDGIVGHLGDAGGDLDGQTGAQEQPAEEVGGADDDADGGGLSRPWR